MPVFNSSLSLYRRTVKRLQPLHIAIHHFMMRAVIPLIERFIGFKTIQDDPFWFRLELLSGRHEAATRQQFERFIKPGMTVLDIGAHVGYYTRLSSKLVGETGHVLAFEPHPVTFAILRENIRFMGNVRIAPVAVSDTEGTAELFDYLMMSASGSLHYDERMLALQKSQLSKTDFAPRITTDFPVRKYAVTTVVIDRYLAEMGIHHADFVKLDVEGAEMMALRGMKEIIRNSPGLILIMEYNPQALRTFGFDPEDALAEVIQMGFSRIQTIGEDGELRDFDASPAQLKQLTSRLMKNMGVINLLFTR